MLGWVPAAGVTTHTDTAFMAQVARNLTDHVDGFLRNTRYLVVDRDTKFTAQFCRILSDAGVKIVRTSYRAPNMNALSERWGLSAKTECLDRMIFFGEESLRRTLHEFVAHYLHHRPHQSLGNELIDGEPTHGTGEVLFDERLGGLLKHFHRAAA